MKVLVMLLALVWAIPGLAWAQKDTMRMGEKMETVVIQGEKWRTVTDLAVLGGAGVACGLGWFLAGRRRK